jgi:hypothetical protein
MTDKLLTVKEAAELLNVSIILLNKLRCEPSTRTFLPYVKIGRTVRYRLEDINKMKGAL